MDTSTNSNVSILIYDGRCPFCTRQAKNLKKWAGPLLQLESFQDPAILARYPALSYDECMKEIKLVAPQGKILGGAHAVFYALSLKPFFRILRRLYLFPFLKQISDLVYAAVAKNRYKIRRKDCPTGSCRFHQSQ